MSLTLCRFTDDELVGANQTNLAVKGIIGIGAMAKISNVSNEEGDSLMYMVCFLDYFTHEMTMLEIRTRLSATRDSGRRYLHPHKEVDC